MDPDAGVFTLSAACMPAGDAAPGEACEAWTDCRAGSLCVRIGVEPGTCVALCDLDTDPECSGAETIGFELAQRTGLSFPPCEEAADVCPGSTTCSDTARGRRCI